MALHSSLTGKCGASKNIKSSYICKYAYSSIILSCNNLVRILCFSAAQCQVSEIKDVFFLVEINTRLSYSTTSSNNE